MSPSAVRTFQPSLIGALNADPTLASLVGPNGVGSAVKQFEGRATAASGSEDAGWPWWVVVDDVTETAPFGGASTFSAGAKELIWTIRGFYRHGAQEKVGLDGVLKLYEAIAAALDERPVAFPSGSGMTCVLGRTELGGTPLGPDGRTVQAVIRYRAQVQWTTS